ncbi:MAG: hypothetical protein LBG14_04375 [Treponema sp.]|jgi:hypothetical protein|nr:hypothetical protein [Treponema sp.]
MYNKLLTVKIIAALGIPLFPLGARLFLSQNNASGFRESARAPQGLTEIPAPAFNPEGPAEAGKLPDRALPPIGAETLARAFRAPNKALPGEEPREDAPQTRPVPGEGKFSYLGSIRESDDREWIYVKEETSGRILSINASLASINEEHCVVEIEGASYFIRRK